MECVNIPPELNENHILKRIGQYLGTLIGFELNKHKSHIIRFLIKTNHNNSIKKKIITNRSIYNLTFTKYTGEINR